MRSVSDTLQGPQMAMTRANPPSSIDQAGGGAVTSNPTPEGNTARLEIPANALPGGVTIAGVSLTLVTGTAVPGAALNSTQTICPAVSASVSGATGNFTQAVRLTFPLPFTFTAGSALPVAILGADGAWTASNGQAVVNADGKSASYNTTIPGTYGLVLPLHVTASVAGTPQEVPVGRPYNDPVVVPVTPATINWNVQREDARAALNSAFIQAQRRGEIPAGEPGIIQLIIHPRGATPIVLVKTDLNLSATGGVVIQQAGQVTTGTLYGLTTFEFRPHQQGGADAF